MPIPSDWDDRVLQRTYEDDRGNPMSGNVTITARVGHVEDDDEATAWFPRPVTVDLDDAGLADFSGANAIRVADPDMRQNQYTHHVTEILHYPEIAGQETPASLRIEYDIHIVPGADPLLYGSLAPVAPSAGVALVDPLFQGPPGPPGTAGAAGAAGTNGTNGANGTNGSNGASAYDLWVANGGSGNVSQFLASLVGPAGASGVGLSAYQDWQTRGHAGASFDDFIAYLVTTFNLLPQKNGTVTLTPQTDKFLRLVLTGNGTDTTTWPNRFEISFQDTGVPIHLTSWFNEYGELRITPGKGNTIPFRLFTRDSPGTPGIDPNAGPIHTVDMIQVVDDRTNRTVLFAVDSEGVVTGKNIGQKVVAQGTPPTDTSVIWIDTSA